MASSLSASAPAVKAVLSVPLPLTPPSAVVLGQRRAAPAVLSVGGGKARRGAAAAVEDLRPAIDEYPEGVLSGEWPENFSLLSYDDLRAYLESQIVTTDKMSPTAKLGDVMSRPVQVAVPGQRLAEIDAFFAAQSGLPVVDKEGRCVGVVSKKDKARAASGMESTVGEVMSSPAITLTPEKTVLDEPDGEARGRDVAAGAGGRAGAAPGGDRRLLRRAVRPARGRQGRQMRGRRLQEGQGQGRQWGIVTRTDVFQVLEANKA